MDGSLGTAAVMGAGAWGTALAKVLADAGADVRIWARRGDVEHEINSAHTNGRYLKGITLPAAIRASSPCAATSTRASARPDDKASSACTAACSVVPSWSTLRFTSSANCRSSTPALSCRVC